MNSANQDCTSPSLLASATPSIGNRTLSDFLQPMIDWIAESAARERAARDSNK
jgi:hypothetical protein